MIMIMHPNDEKQFLARLFEDPKDARAQEGLSVITPSSKGKAGRRMLFFMTLTK